MSQMTQ
jgi:hypothetical protein